MPDLSSLFTSILNAATSGLSTEDLEARVAKAQPCDDPTCMVCPAMLRIVEMRKTAENIDSVVNGSSPTGRIGGLAATIRAGLREVTDVKQAWLGTRHNVYDGTSAIGDLTKDITVWLPTEAAAMAFLEEYPNATVEEIGYVSVGKAEVVTPEPTLRTKRA